MKFNFELHWTSLFVLPALCVSSMVVGTCDCEECRRERVADGETPTHEAEAWCVSVSVLFFSFHLVIGGPS